MHSEGSDEPGSSNAHAQRPNNYLLLVAESDVKQMEAVKMGHEPQECHEMIFWPKGGAGREDPRRIWSCRSIVEFRGPWSLDLYHEYSVSLISGWFSYRLGTAQVKGTAILWVVFFLSAYTKNRPFSLMRISQTISGRLRVTYHLTLTCYF